MFRLLSLVIVACVLTSCRTKIGDHAGPDVDMRGTVDRCELHKVAMRSARVPAAIGCALPQAGYLEARDKSFPHSYPQVLQSRKRYHIIYVCDDCITAESAWARTR